MNFLKVFKVFIFETYRRRRLILMSVAISFIAWIITIICIDRYSVVVFKDVSIVTNLTNTQTEQLGLDVVKIEPTSVSVKLKGPRHKLAMLSKDDLVVTPISFKNMTSDGDYKIDLKVDLKQAQPDVSVEAVAPNSAVFSVDLLTTKLVNVNCSLSNIQAAEGFVIDFPVCQPKNLYVSGPKKFIDCLDAVQLNVNSMQKNLNSTKTFDADAKFVRNDGTELDSNIFKYDKSVKFSVTFPIYKNKQVPLTFMYKNAPSCFDLSLLKYSINPDKISLGLSNEIANSLKELSMGYIDMHQLDFGTNFNFKLVVPAGCRNLSQIDSVNVTFDTSDWCFKYFNAIDDIRIINPNDKYSVKIKSPVLKKVKVLGLKEEYLNNVNRSDITATVDLSSVKLKPGEQTVIVNLGILNKSGVWVAGTDYKCCIYCKPIEN